VNLKTAPATLISLKSILKVSAKRILSLMLLKGRIHEG
jgi:hypothetical protein